MDADTSIGGFSTRFPATRHSAVLQAAGDQPEERDRALGAIASAYWKPLYKYFRIRWRLSNEDAKDAVQSFFAALIEKQWLSSFDRQKGSFRTFLRTCADRHAAHRREYDQAGKRSPGSPLLPLDFDTGAADRELASEPAAEADLDLYFHREWVRALFEQAVSGLRESSAARGRQQAYRAWEMYDLDAGESRPTYAAIAQSLQVPEVSVTNWIAAMRRDFRTALLERLRALTASDREFESEAAALFGLRGL
jgi:hypothetical protein